MSIQQSTGESTPDPNDPRVRPWTLTIEDELRTKIDELVDENGRYARAHAQLDAELTYLDAELTRVKDESERWQALYMRVADQYTALKDATKTLTENTTESTARPTRKGTTMTHITTAGNLAADPEIRTTPKGSTVARFTIIENRRRRTPEGGWEDDEPNRFTIEAWGDLADHIAASLRKGSRAHVSGRISTDRWTDKKTGEARTAQKIIADDVSLSLRWTAATPVGGTDPGTAAEAAPVAPVDGWDVAEIPNETF